MKKYDELMSDEDHHYFRNQKEGLKQISNFVSNSSKSLLKLKPFYPKGLSYFKLIVQIFEIVKVHSIGWLNSYTKFTFFTTTVFHNLIYKGFCAKEEPEQEQKQGEDEYNFGTGVGEG
jgi:midasin (ATPase involved in ribosome maturation)